MIFHNYTGIITTYLLTFILVIFISVTLNLILYETIILKALI